MSIGTAKIVSAMYGHASQWLVSPRVGTVLSSRREIPVALSAIEEKTGPVMWSSRSWSRHVIFEPLVSFMIATNLPMCMMIPIWFPCVCLSFWKKWWQIHFPFLDGSILSAFFCGNVWKWPHRCCLNPQVLARNSMRSLKFVDKSIPFFFPGENPLILFVNSTIWVPQVSFVIHVINVIHVFPISPWPSTCRFTEGFSLPSLKTPGSARSLHPGTGSERRPVEAELGLDPGRFVEHGARLSGEAF